jgi:hypothetical protein
MRKSLFNYSFYSHPEIGKFQGVTDMDMDYIFNQHTDHVTIKVDVQMEIMWDDVATY